ncbi:MAG TPA: carbonic anhydrase [Thermoanaerobaculia bacterium]
MTALALSLACALSLSAQTSPEWKILDKGNKDFQGESISFPDLVYARTKLSNGQNPPVTVLSCSDSRVPPELVFKRSLGQIFLVRSAGNVTDSLGIASIEYALTKKWTKLLVILAHDKCGAVEAAINGLGKPTDENRNLQALVDKIRESFNNVPCPNPAECWAFRTRQNALNTIEDLKRRSPIIRKAVDVDKLPVVIGLYELKSGKVLVWKTINN